MVEDRRAAHAVQGFENDVTLLGGELAQNVDAPAHQGRRRALRELGGEQLLVAVAQALRAVDHQQAFALGLLQQLRAVEEFVVERRVLAHQDHVQLVQGQILLVIEMEPMLGIMDDLQRARAGPHLAVAQVEVLLFHVEQRPAAGLGGEQHGQRAVLLEGYAGDGVHDDAQANAHRGSPLQRNNGLTAVQGD
ncbi:hypothetical protein D3C81_1243940 [compost metagenome]